MPAGEKFSSHVSIAVHECLLVARRGQRKPDHGDAGIIHLADFVVTKQDMGVETRAADRHGLFVFCSGIEIREGMFAVLELSALHFLGVGEMTRNRISIR